VKGPVEFAGGARGMREFGYDSGSKRILIDERVWREVVLMGHWIRDAVILRWAEVTSRLSGGELAPGTVLDRLVRVADPLRMDQDVRELYESAPAIECVWTGKRLDQGFEVDHAIPVALWQDSSLWNLFPAAKKVNNSKRDLLPATSLIRQREETIIAYWRMLSCEFPTRFMREAAILAGHRVPAPEALLPSNRERPLLHSFVEAIEYTARIRGTGRWEP